MHKERIVEYWVVEASWCHTFDWFELSSKKYPSREYAISAISLEKSKNKSGMVYRVKHVYTIYRDNGTTRTERWEII